MSTSSESLPPIETILPADFIALLGQISHALPLSFTALTRVRTREKAYVDARDPQPRIGWSKPPVELGDMAELRYSPFAEVFKLSRVQAMTGADFEAAVNRVEAKEGQTPLFEAGERQWGVRAGPALVHKAGPDGGSYYLACHVLRAARPLYLARGLNGLLSTVPKEVLLPFLPPDPIPAAAAHQGVSAPVTYRNYAISSLAFAALNRRRLRIRHVTPLPITTP